MQVCPLCYATVSFAGGCEGDAKVIDRRDGDDENDTIDAWFLAAFNLDEAAESSEWESESSASDFTEYAVVSSDS